MIAWHFPQCDHSNFVATVESPLTFYSWNCIPVRICMSGGVVSADTPRPPYSPIYWTAPAFWNTGAAQSIRADILNAVGIYDERSWYRIGKGDSGRPCFIRIDGRDIPIAQTHWVSGGSSIPAAAKMLRAYCAANGCNPKSFLNNQ